MKTKKFLATAAAAIVLASGMVAVAAPAQAINRAEPCGGPTYLRVFSDNTTCWANAGTANVNLYNATGAQGGNNNGYVKGGGNTYYVTRFGNSVLFSSRTITVVHID